MLFCVMLKSTEVAVMLVLFSFRNCCVVFSFSRFWLCLFLACEAAFALFVLAV